MMLSKPVVVVMVALAAVSAPRFVPDVNSRVTPASSVHVRTSRVQATITGRVFVDANANGRLDDGEDGVPNVAVSDQLQVVVTDANGQYQLPVNRDVTRLVFVSVPTGFTIRTPFYRSVNATTAIPVNFALTRQPTPTTVTFIHASDTHVSTAVLARTQRFRALIDSIHPAFVIITGDLVKDALRVGEPEATGYYDLFQSEIAKITVPVWTVPGNHENFGVERDLSHVREDHPLYGRAMYHHYRGPDYYSFNTGGVHFVGLNSVDIDDTRYYGHVDSTQLAWLERDLAVVPVTTPVVTFNHIPFFSSMEGVRGHTEAPPAPSIITVNGKPQYRHVVSNAAEVLARVRGHAYPLALAGHIHARERIRYEGIDTRFEQAAAIVAPTPAAGVMFTSGITVYHMTNGIIDAGTFVPLGLDPKVTRDK